MTTSWQDNLLGSTAVSFADVAHQTLLFDRSDPSCRLVLDLIDTKWVQRLRSLSQTGNTRFVYMFAEHSRFGHSLGAAYLAVQLLKHLARYSPGQVEPYVQAVAAAALLHDVGHAAPGSHLAERVWSQGALSHHESITVRIVREDPEIRQLLDAESPELAERICSILTEDPALPPWTHSVISGGGWNVDRGNWTLVDSEMCSVTYGRYNVGALVDSFRLSPDGKLLLLENRLDALTHFFVARDSMYRQVYQHRVLQSMDSMTQNVIARIRDLLVESDADTSSAAEVCAVLGKRGIFCDETLASVLTAENYAEDLPIDVIFNMTEQWWGYHLSRWCSAPDPILADLCHRLRERKLFKTIRLHPGANLDRQAVRAYGESHPLFELAKKHALEAGLDPKYYVALVDDSDKHRGSDEEAPLILREDGEIISVDRVEPLIGQILARQGVPKLWIAVPKNIKDRLGRRR